MKISYINLGVSDIAESERFYRDILGLPAERKGEDVHVRWPDFLLILSENPPSARGKFHFGFRVDKESDVDAWVERLRSHDVRIIAGPASLNGARQVFFLDPDQYEVRIYSE